MRVETLYKLPKQKDIKTEHSKKVKIWFTIEESNSSPGLAEHITGCHTLDPLPGWPSYQHMCYFLSKCEGSLRLYIRLPRFLKADDFWLLGFFYSLQDSLPLQ